MKPTSVYFIGSPDQLHLFQSLIKEEDHLISVESLEKSELVLTLEKHKDLIPLDDRKLLTIPEDFDEQKEELQKIILKLKPAQNAES